jgi:hypothetical protein
VQVKRLERVAELESLRRATAQDAKALMLGAVRSERQLTPPELHDLNRLRGRTPSFEDQIQALLEPPA